MSIDVIEKQFEKMGARIKVNEFTPNRWNPNPSGGPTIDIGNDKRGEFFLVRVTSMEQLEDLSVLQVDKDDRHLLLMHRDGRIKSKFLCGHDERHWFVAAIPEAASASGVKEAKLALQPDGVRQVIAKLKPKNALKRRNEAYIRQGEWFFIPLDHTPEGLVHKNEPITRGRGKPHIVEHLIREGGNTVFVVSIGGRVISQNEWNRLGMKERRALGHVTQRSTVGRVFAKGAIRHPDHATIYLDCWHEVEMNTEQRSRAMASVTFLD